MLPSPCFMVHFSINELGFCQFFALWSHHLAPKSEIVPELNNISVVRDFPNIFSEVLPGSFLTVVIELVIKLVSL